PTWSLDGNMESGRLRIGLGSAQAVLAVKRRGDGWIITESPVAARVGASLDVNALVETMAAAGRDVATATVAEEAKELTEILQAAGWGVSAAKSTPLRALSFGGGSTSMSTSTPA